MVTTAKFVGMVILGIVLAMLVMMASPRKDAGVSTPDHGVKYSEHDHHGSPAYQGLDMSTLSDDNDGQTDRKLCVTDREADRNPVYAEGYYGQGNLFRVWEYGGSGNRNCREAPGNLHNHRVEEDTDGNPPGDWSIH